MRGRIIAVALVTLTTAASAVRAQPPVSRGAATIAAAVGRTGVMAFSGVRAPGACLVPVRPFSAVSANGVKITFGAVHLREVTFTVHDKRTRRVEVLGLGGNSFCMLVGPCATVRVPMPAGFGPPLALRLEPAPALPSTAELFR